MTGDEFKEIMSRFLRGYINKDLHGKAVDMDEALTVVDFGFLTARHKINEASLAQKEIQSEEKEPPRSVSPSVRQLASQGN